ncbi:signal recognition particle, SRP19 subunit [Lasiosphaeria hispida]|uniref:Signal recognition particle, SRP19 subunit n=1 Tax=Lasiosphaeria hispida TaxID=260671 RepID=A0AAJ0M9L4_9PEZI|nr:signal recognition particle, SRP19 subunit [Lasiosphaeria hispida]
MPSHPRVEEVEDSDVEMSDPSEGDIDDFADEDIIRFKPTAAAAPAPPTTLPLRPSQPPHPSALEMQTTTDDAPYRSYQCLYPIYFDARRSRAEGRRVTKSLAVLNPLAMEIVFACQALAIPAVFEAGKLHPKDWANPGRVRVALRDHHPRIKNKHHLYILIGKHLVANPATDDSAALRKRVAGAPPPPQVEAGGAWPRPAVPRGWKMGELLPYYSPAMTGGGVSENFLKDMMKEMQGGGDMASILAAAAGGAGGAGPSAVEEKGRKRDKKGKGKS